ncbi:MAG: hypothetical protein H7318_14215 [Oligoflexus sp.]|nr:hypothetical protein [Oligoflexus sp.]
MNSGLGTLPVRWMPGVATKVDKSRLKEMVEEAKVDPIPEPVLMPVDGVRNVMMLKSSKNEFGVTFDVPEQSFTDPSDSLPHLALKVTLSPFVWRWLKSQDESASEIIDELVRAYVSKGGAGL